MTKATQEGFHLRDPRKRTKPLQMELPFNDRKGKKARQALGRHLGDDLKSFACTFRDMKGVECIVMAHDSGEAKALYYRELHQAHPSAKWTEIRICRGAEDCLSAKLGKGVYSPATIALAAEKAAKSKKQHGNKR